MSAVTLLQLPKTYYSPGTGMTYDILGRSPYTMAGDVTIAAGASPQVMADGTFVHNLDLPFEVLRMIPTIACLDSNSAQIADPNIGSLLHLVQLQLQLLTQGRPMTSAAASLSELVDNELRTWAFDSPLYLERSNGFQPITVTNNIPVGSAAKAKVRISFQGSLLALSQGRK